MKAAILPSCCSQIFLTGLLVVRPVLDLRGIVLASGYNPLYCVSCSAAHKSSPSRAALPSAKQKATTPMNDTTIAGVQPVDHEAVRARLNAATPGPWEAGDRWVYTTPIYDDDPRLMNVLGVVDHYAEHERVEAERKRGQANAELIAHAPADLAALLVENQRLRDTIQAVEETVARSERQGFERVAIVWLREALGVSGE